MPSVERVWLSGGEQDRAEQVRGAAGRRLAGSPILQRFEHLGELVRAEPERAPPVGHRVCGRVCPVAVEVGVELGDQDGQSRGEPRRWSGEVAQAARCRSAGCARTPVVGYSGQG